MYTVLAMICLNAILKMQLTCNFIRRIITECLSSHGVTYIANVVVIRCTPMQKGIQT